MTLMGVFDLVLVTVLILCAWIALTAPDLLRSVILFIAFGLLVALAWVRLAAPDVAMAEAAVGSGLTGAMLLSALSAMRRNAAKSAQAQAQPPVQDMQAATEVGADRVQEVEGG